MLRIKKHQPIVKAVSLGAASVVIGMFSILGVQSVYGPNEPVIITVYDRLPADKQVAADEAERSRETDVEDTADATATDPAMMWWDIPAAETKPEPEPAQPQPAASQPAPKPRPQPAAPAPSQPIEEPPVVDELPVVDEPDTPSGTDDTTGASGNNNVTDTTLRGAE